MSSIFHIRPATVADRDFIVMLAPRLLAGMPPWRDPAAWLVAMQGFMKKDIDGTDDKTQALIAEDEQGQPLGFISMSQSRHFTGVPQLYIGELAVTAAAEGKGVGSALLAAAEQHARALGLRFIALDTGAQQNDHGRAFYQRQGFAEESLRLIKVLEVNDD